MSVLVVDVLTDTAALVALRPAWQALWRRVPGATPFQSPAWLLPWWEVFGTDSPVVATIRTGDRLAGLLPLYRLDVGNERKLLPIGIGVSDYLDALLDPALPPGALDRLLDAALRAAGPGVVCDLAEVPPDGALRRMQPPAGWRAAWHRGATCPVLTIPPGAEQAGQAVPGGWRRKLRMNRHRAAALGGGSVTFADAASIDAATDRLLHWNAQRWGDGDPAARQFHRRAVRHLLPAGLLRLATLHIGGAPAACCYALADRGERLLFTMIGFDPAYATVSPGSLLIAGMIDAAIQEGRREVHFLRGDEAYKYAWGAQDRCNAACRLVAR